MKPSLNRVAWVGAAGLVAALAFWLWPNPEKTAQRSALDNRLLAMQMLGEWLARKFPGQRALVIGNPFTQKRGQRKEIYAFDAAAVGGLRKGLGQQIVLVAEAFPEVRSEFLQQPDSVQIDPKTTTPLSYLVAEKSFDALAQKHSDCGILVSLIGLPANLSAADFWRRANGPKLALLLPDLRVVGERAAIRSAFKAGKIAAAVLN